MQQAQEAIKNVAFWGCEIVKLLSCKTSELQKYWSVVCDQPPHGDSAMRMRFWCESSARVGKNLCDTVVANFSFVEPRPLPRAFHTKARSHCTITAPPGWLGLCFWHCRKPGE
jgi:hypothetical protein